MVVDKIEGRPPTRPISTLWPPSSSDESDEEEDGGDEENETDYSDAGEPMELLCRHCYEHGGLREIGNLRIRSPIPRPRGPVPFGGSPESPSRPPSPLCSMVPDHEPQPHSPVDVSMPETRSNDRTESVEPVRGPQSSESFCSVRAVHPYHNMWYNNAGEFVAPENGPQSVDWSRLDSPAESPPRSPVPDRGPQSLSPPQSPVVGSVPETRSNDRTESVEPAVRGPQSLKRSKSGSPTPGRSHAKKRRESWA